VKRLVLYGGWVRGAEIASPAIQEHVLGLVAANWGFGSDVLAEIFAPDADTATRAAYTRFQRAAATAEAARTMLALCYQVDITHDLARIHAPTLVMHRDRDRAAPLAQGKMLAEGIAGARFELLPGQAHLPYVGDGEAITRLTRKFLGLPALRPRVGLGLTPRQYEVAALVADGLTNRQIAQRLQIAERSAESHVERIRTQMGFHTRSQIAAWFVSGARPN
jgi:DNA-binding CsgD family transcriptional regulator